MFLNELAEPQIVVIYPGRFQPFHKGHAKVFQQLVGKFGRNNVFVVTSNKVADPKKPNEIGRYPFSFSEKAYFMQLAGVPEDRIVEVSNPFQTKSVMASGRISVLNPENAVIIFAVSEKDMQDNPETGEKPYFEFKPKKDGTPSYYQPLPSDIRETENMNVHGYVMTVPVFEFEVLGQPFTSSTEVRQEYINSDEPTRQQIIKDLFGNYTQEAEQIMTSKLTAQPPSIEEAPMLPNKVKMKKVKMPKMTMEGKIKLSTDPNWYGAEPGDYKATGPVVNIPANKLVGFEPDDKMNQPKSKVNVEKIVAGLKQGDKLPPLLVRQYKNGYQVLDGHHRFWAYKLLGVESIPAQIVPAKDIEEIGKQGVMEGKAATPTDPKRNELIKKAKLAHPNASSDEEALALFINDKEERDISNVEREEQGIEVKVANLEKKFQQLDAKMKAFAQVKARPTPVEEMGGVGVVKGGNDPRYCMATAGDQNDVNGKTLSKELRGFKLAEDRELFLKLRDELTK